MESGQLNIINRKSDHTSQKGQQEDNVIKPSSESQIQDQKKELNHTKGGRCWPDRRNHKVDGNSPTPTTVTGESTSTSNNSSNNNNNNSSNTSSLFSLFRAFLKF